MVFKNEDKKLKKHFSIDETDCFWEINDITPYKKTTKKKQSKTELFDNEAVLVTDETIDTQGVNIKPQPIKKIEETKTKLLLSYSPSNSLINNVNIYNWHTKYTFYERFMHDAQKYYTKTANEVQPVRYYSYMPSYVQMSLRQREWYFYWRSLVRKKQYLPTDSSYILLYVYEIINLPDIIQPQEAIGLLCDIWEHYRTDYTKLDKYMSEWVCDYCLINKIDFPFERMSNIMTDIVENSIFKQFYLVCDAGEEYACLLLEKLSSYRWKKSKYLNDENRGLFENHIRNAFCYAVKKYAEFDGRFNASSGRLTEKKAVRDSYSGALCAYEIKRKIEVSYFDLTNVSDLVFVVTDMVRYCENRVRAYLGVRARLSVQNLTEQQKGIINEYFDKYLPAAFYEKKKNQHDLYEEAFIEEEKKPFEVSFENARKIEESSWQITDRLVEEELYKETGASEHSQEKSVEGESLDFAKQALIYIFQNDMQSFGRIADESFMLPETLAECVNELCFEIIGDIGIEEIEGEYRIIPDYEQEIKKWLNL